jgi:hypothetical protein
MLNIGVNMAHMYLSKRIAVSDFEDNLYPNIIIML